jgi:hypothetical protein
MFKKVWNQYQVFVFVLGYWQIMSVGLEELTVIILLLAWWLDM